MEKKFNLTNLMAFPMDVETLDGPAILPSGGKLENVRLDALQIHVMESSSFVEIEESKSAKAAEAPASGGKEPSGKGSGGAGGADGRPAAASGADAGKAEGGKPASASSKK